MKALIFPRDKLIKIRYNKDSELPVILKELRKIPNLDMKKVIEIIENIDEWFIDRFEASLNSQQKMPLHHFILHSLWFIPRNFIGKWYLRIFVRGKCAIKGCDEHYSCGGNLPDDVCEWYCKRCGAEGINQVVYTRELFYSDTPLRNFWGALRGR